MENRQSLKTIIADRSRSQFEGILSDVSEIYNVVSTIIDKENLKNKKHDNQPSRLSTKYSSDQLAIDNMVTDIAKTLEGFYVFAKDYYLFLDRCIQSTYPDEIEKRYIVTNQVKREWMSLRPLVLDRLSLLKAHGTAHLAKVLFVADAIAEGCLELSGLTVSLNQKLKPRVYFEKTFSISRFYYETRMPSIAIPLEDWHDPWNWMGLAHEVGHFVLKNVLINVKANDDLGKTLRDLFFKKLMTKALGRATRGTEAMPNWTWQSVNETLPVWYRWVDEIFADCFGAFILGPAYIESLIAWLGSTFTPETLIQDDTDHPLPLIRPLLQIETIRKVLINKQGPTLDSERLRQDLDALEIEWIALCLDVLKIEHRDEAMTIEELGDYKTLIFREKLPQIPPDVAFVAIDIAADVVVTMLVNEKIVSSQKPYLGDTHTFVIETAKRLVDKSAVDEIQNEFPNALRLPIAWYAWTQVMSNREVGEMDNIRAWVQNTTNKNSDRQKKLALRVNKNLSVLGERRTLIEHFLPAIEAMLPGEPNLEAIGRFANTVITFPGSEQPFDGEPETLRKFVDLMLASNFSTDDGLNTCRKCDGILMKPC